ncbi:MAG: patatin-like phospholipase family protein [Roseovarius sp.]|jgi:NTE family protein|nr:patatin-like phospholipase family protein [Roseovarius sp.]
MTRQSKATQPIIGLVLAGGGARGAYQVGVLKAIAKITGSRDNPFAVITGVSGGAINAAALASRASDFKNGVEWLEELWGGLHAHNVYRTDFPSIGLCSLNWILTMLFGGLGSPNPRSLLDSTPLGKLLHREIDLDELQKAIETGALDALAVTASSYGEGRAKTFFQGKGGLTGWRRARRDGLPDVIGIDHILASTALPLIFRTQGIGGEYFGDGALRLTAPLSPAIRLGAQKILVVGTRDENCESPDEEMRCPSIGDIVGYMMDVLFNDNLNADLERIKRVNETLKLLPKGRREETALRRIEVHIVRPSRDIRMIAGEHADTLPWTIKMLLRGVGAWGADWRVPSYILFEQSYCRALIDLGYEDTMAGRQELCEFLETA